MAYTTRVLPPEEWAAKAAELTHLAGVPDPAGSLLVVVEDDGGRIIATWVVMNVIHLEGLHIDPAHRHSPAAKALFTGMLEAVTTLQAPAVVTLTSDPLVARMAAKVGFAKVFTGDVWQLDLRGIYHPPNGDA